MLRLLSLLLGVYMGGGLALRGRLRAYTRWQLGGW